MHQEADLASARARHGHTVVLVVLTLITNTTAVGFARRTWRSPQVRAPSVPHPVQNRVVGEPSVQRGNAEPQALVLAQAAANATQLIGMPECQLPLAQAAIYLACSPKSNASAVAIWEAGKDVREGRTNPVPKHVKGSGYAGAKRLGSGNGYRYPHDEKDGIVEPDYYGVEKVYYTPTDRGAEAILHEYLKRRRREDSGAPPSIKTC